MSCYSLRIEVTEGIEAKHYNLFFFSLFLEHCDCLRFLFKILLIIPISNAYVYFVNMLGDNVFILKFLVCYLEVAVQHVQKFDVIKATLKNSLGSQINDSLNWMFGDWRTLK